MKKNGFTLIEIMIVVAVIGILAAIAFPSYSRYVDRSAIADGKSLLLSAAQQMERCFTRENTYTGCDGVDERLSDGRFYAIDVGDPTTTTYSISALAQRTPPRPETCRTLTLNQRGVTGPEGCWD